jgi:hypothetical protein
LRSTGNGAFCELLCHAALPSEAVQELFFAISKTQRGALERFCLALVKVAIRYEAALSLFDFCTKFAACS